MGPLSGVYTVNVSLVIIIQNRACRLFLGVPKNTANCAIQGEMGWVTCVTKQRIEAIRWFLKLSKSHTDRLTHKLFNWSLTRKGSFAHSVTKLAKQLKLDMWLLSLDSISKSMLFVKHRLRRLDEETWFASLWNDKNNVNGNKLRTYRLYKKDLITEPYLRAIMHRNKRRNFSRFRCGNLPLHIETGRYNKPSTPLNDRICPFCSSIETESHFLLNCTFYNDIRFPLLKIVPLDS